MKNPYKLDFSYENLKKIHKKEVKNYFQNI